MKAERRSFTISEMKDYIYHRDGGTCRNCGRDVRYPGQLAHLIPQSQANIEKYGEEVIHHEENMKLVCSLQCNNALQITNRPEAISNLVFFIRYRNQKEVSTGDTKHL